MQTALFSKHQALNAKFIDFFGWQMPFSYTSVVKEHQNIRSHVGLFDVSHMGEVFVSGASAEAFLNHLTLNQVSALKGGQGQYTALCNHDGGMIDDLLLYKIRDHFYLLCINASRVEADVAWIKARAQEMQDLTISHESNAWSQIAIQGPLTHKVLEAAATQVPAFGKILNYNEITAAQICGYDAYVARTGYTGELGYEIYIKNEGASRLWDILMECGAPFSISPVGLGARDTLRLEACYPLYGNEMNDSVSPLEADLGWIVKWQKPDFIGKRALEAQKASGLQRKLFAFRMIDPSIPRHDMIVCDTHEKPIGMVTSGCSFPHVGGSGGMALLNSSAKIGDQILVDIRGKFKLAEIVKKPFYVAKTKED
jgi:aminomethyltransferase